MSIIYFIISIVMWVLIGYAVYHLLKKIVFAVKNKIFKRKEVNENENYEC